MLGFLPQVLLEFLSILRPFLFDIVGHVLHSFLVFLLNALNVLTQVTDLVILQLMFHLLL